MWRENDTLVALCRAADGTIARSRPSMRGLATDLRTAHGGRSDDFYRARSMRRPLDRSCARPISPRRRRF